MRIAFLGTSEYAATVLERLARSPHRPALVVTPPDRPRGRGRRLASPPAAQAARELELDVLQTENVNLPDVVEEVHAARPALAVVCAFGQLIKDPLLAELEMLNVHPSFLPRWRGAAPIELLNETATTETGVTILRVTAGYDSGPIAVQERAEIRPRDDYGTLATRLAELGGELIVGALDQRGAGELRFVEQDDALATYAEKIAPTERRLDPERAAGELERRVRALTPHIGAYLELDGERRLGVLDAVAEDEELEPGALSSDGRSLLLGCGAGTLRLEVVRPEGGRPMPAAAYLRGHPVPQLAG